MEQIDQTQAVNPGTAQAGYGSAGAIPEDLRARSRRGWAVQGEAKTNRNHLRSTAPAVDSAEISNAAWQYYLGRSGMSTHDPQNVTSAPSYAGFRNDKKSVVEFLLWQRAEEDRGYLSERLAGDPSSRAEESGQEDYTLQRMVTLLYFSGSRTQRVAFAHYKADETRPDKASRKFNQAAATGQPAFYQTNI